MAPIHLLVLIHGMWGNPGHLAELARIARETHSTASDGTKLHVLLAEAISEDSTYDGIDWGGERVADEVANEIKQLEVDDEVVRFSVMGYSLGGLVARYLVGILHQRGFFEKVTPVNFNTIATPHIGLLRYPSFISSVFSSLGPKLLSRTGEQFYCVDEWSPNGQPLILTMADPDKIFYQALSSFKHIRIYANAINDVTVPYVTAAIETEDPFAEYDTNGIEIDFDDKYEKLVRHYSLPAVPPPLPPKPAVLSVDWFRSMKPRRPLLPPALQLRFPLNLILYTFLPLLVPVFLSLAILNFSLKTRSSRARIKLLEASSSNQAKLIHVFAELESQVEEMVVDLVDDPNPSSRGVNITRPQAHPILSPYQRKSAAWLNQLPIQKELAYFTDVRNSHAMIVCRDVKRFELHKLGEGVLRHWANAFIL